MARDRRSHIRKNGALPAAPPSAEAISNVPLAKTTTVPHPSLIKLVQLLARQAAKADVAAQRSSRKED